MRRKEHNDAQLPCSRIRKKDSGRFVLLRLEARYNRLVCAALSYLQNLTSTLSNSFLPKNSPLGTRFLLIVGGPPANFSSSQAADPKRG